MKVSLRARRKWGFLDGTHKQPEDDAPEMEDWWTVQSMLVSWILNTIEPNLRSTITYVENVKDLWEDIKERFSVVNGPRIQQLKVELAECKQQGTTMVTYYGKLKTLWDELANYEQIPKCTCGGCNCNIGSRLEKRREEERVHQFLMGLDDVGYGTVRSNILAMDPLPSLNRVYSTMVQEERMKMITRTKEEREAVSVMGLSVQIGYKKKGRTESKQLLCSHCGRLGHDVKGCFQLVGYPEWWNDRPRNEGTNNKSTQKQGARGRSGVMRANTAHVETEPCSEKKGEPSSVVTGLSNEQWQTLIEMLNANKANGVEKMNGKGSCVSWIIDSGASNHMTGNSRNLKEQHNVEACVVGLPKGEEVHANKEGTVILEGGLKLKNVLYVPKLRCNLISVSQLTDDVNCLVLFTNKLCVMQDCTSRMLIGAGEHKDGLYLFRGTHKIKAYQTSVEKQVDLWHKRLGHPS